MTQVNLTDQPLHQQAFPVFDTIENAGGEIRFIGGCVRDLLCNKPVTDIDAATTFEPNHVIELLTTNGIKVIPTGIDHGTVTAVIDHMPMEITTLREDVDCYGRHAEVAYTKDWQVDASRRDFTINAMSLDKRGNLYDYFDGIADLTNHKVQFIGKAHLRIQEDYLRILRFFRFSATYATQFDQEGIQAARAERAGISQLSRERIGHEMLKLLMTPQVVEALTIMQSNGILETIIPQASRFSQLARLLIAFPKSDVILRIASILRQAGYDMEAVTAFSTSWRLSNHQRDLLLSLIKGAYMVPTESKEQKRWLRKLGKEVAYAKVKLAYAEERLNQEDAMAIIQWVEQWKIPEFPLTGKALITSGVAPGKALGALLHKGEEWWETHDYTPNQQQIIDYLTKEG